MSRGRRVSIITDDTFRADLLITKAVTPNGDGFVNRPHASRVSGMMLASCTPSARAGLDKPPAGFRPYVYRGTDNQRAVSLLALIPPGE